MNHTLLALARVLRMDPRRVHGHWKLAKRHATAEMQRGNYILSFKLMCKVLKVAGADALPDAVGDKVFYGMEKATITWVCPDEFTLRLDKNDQSVTIPLLNLLLCEHRQPELPPAKDQAETPAGERPGV